ncbi:MAG: sensor histidine kinase [Bacteroidota bacterium]
MILEKDNRFSLYLFLFIALNLSIGCNPKSNINISNSIAEVDSVTIWIDLAKKKNLVLEKRKSYLLKAYQLNNKNKIDSVKYKNLSIIAYEAYKNIDTPFFKKTNSDAFILSKKLKDTFGIADSHWNYGNFFVKEEKLDSAYYHYHKALLNFNSINNEYYSGKMLYNMAFIQGRVKNYTASEKLTFHAISKFKPLKKYLNLYRCYNQVGITFKDMEEYDKSINYHKNALFYLRKVKNKKTYKEWSLNNIGLVYQYKGLFSIAIKYFEKALKNDSVRIKNINLYARLIDNLAYNKFLNGDTTNLPQEFYKSLVIRDSLNNKSAVAISKLHLAEYFTKYTDTLKAIEYAKDALYLSKEVNNNRDILSSLKLLSSIDKVNSDTYLGNYISLTDSLQKEERKIRDKFTRIQFETDEYIEETKELSRQRNWIIATSFLLLSIVLLISFIMRQKAKNKELLLETEQEKSNQEIYKLMLSQHSKMNEAKQKERKRISEDLHDGVLGSLFAIRLGLDIFDIKGDEGTKKKYQTYKDEINNTELEIRNISHELKSNIHSSDDSYFEIVKELLEKQSKISNFEFNLSHDDQIVWEDVDTEIKTNIYRIIQETIQNINKYAKASFVEIHFTLEKEMLHLIIKDNGVGFDTQNNKKGIGLKNMASRVKKLGGTIQIDSIINTGTTINISVPL